MRAVLPFVLTVLTGCASLPRSDRSADWPADKSSPNENAVPALIASAATTSHTEPHLLSLNLWEPDPLGQGWWISEDSTLLPVEMGDSESSGKPPADNTVAKESLLSKSYWKLVGLDIKETFTAPARWETGDWLVLGSVAAGIGIVAVFDEDIQKAVQRNRSATSDDIFKAIEPFGAEYSFAVLGAFYVGGEIWKDSRATSVALDGLSASIIASGLVDLPLKYTIGRSRPRQDQGAYHFAPFSGNDSFPSGHATQAFAVASVIAEHYDSLWIKLVSYGMASGVGYARLNSNAHWASDVLAGAAIGTTVGHIVVRFNQHHRKVSVMPIVGPHMQGAELTYSF